MTPPTNLIDRGTTSDSVNPSWEDYALNDGMEDLLPELVEDPPAALDAPDALLPDEIADTFLPPEPYHDPLMLQMRILYLVTIHPGWDFIDIADALGLPFTTVAPAVQEMIQQGLLLPQEEPCD